jgi:hypothetical protein
MRKVALHMYVTLDGVMEAPQNWSFSFWGDASRGTPSTGCSQPTRREATAP